MPLWLLKAKTTIGSVTATWSFLGSSHCRPSASCMHWASVTTQSQEWWRNRIGTLLDAWTKEMKLEVRRFPRMMYSVAASTNEQRISWSNGTHHPDMSPGVLLKYVTEYEDTKRTQRERWQCKKYGWTPSCSARFQYCQRKDPKVLQITGAVNLLLGIVCA